MKVLDKPLSIERSGLMVEQNFRIKPNRKAFAILSSGLYSNKIKAIVRELGTNAADAHISAKNDGPFTVHLPNSLEPYFSVRDYGTGLSPEDITTIYTTYFESTKTESNDVTGCLGLGSKSPFSYTDNFTVVDYYNGSKHTYSAFIAEEGFPTIVLMNTEETSEPNGLEVSFAVKPGDFDRFKSEAKEVYQYFATRPNISGQTVVFNEGAKPVFSGADWSVYKQEGSSRVVMGNVCYPLNLYSCGISSQVFNYHSIQINVAIGEVEMTASRESLEYTEHTIAAIKRRVDECVTQFKERMQAELQAQPTYWDAIIFNRENSLWLGSKPKWRDVELKESIRFPLEYNCLKFERDWSKIKMKRDYHISGVRPNSEIKFVINDIPRGAQDRVRSYLKNNRFDGVVYVIRFADGEIEGFYNTLRGVSEGTIPDGIILKASDLPKPERVARTGQSSPACQTFTFKGARYKRGKEPNKSDYWEEVEEAEIDFSEDGVYVELENWTVVDGNASRIQNMIDKMTDLDHEVTVYGFRKKTAALVKRLSNWKHLEVEAKEVVARHSNKFDFVVTRHKYTKYQNLLQLAKMFPSNDLKALLDRIKYVEDNYRQLSAIDSLMIATSTTHYVDIDIDGEVSKYKEKYPLIFHLMHYGDINRIDSNDIKQYVTLIDQQAALAGQY